MNKKYLFFDIESIDRKSRYTCTFGYLLVDSNFNIIEKDDILINPNVIEYDWYVLKNMFYYTKEDAVVSPSFYENFNIDPEAYEDISITTLPFSVRVISRLKKTGIFTVADLVKSTPSELMKLNGFGKSCLD